MRLRWLSLEQKPAILPLEIPLFPDSPRHTSGCDVPVYLSHEMSSACPWDRPPGRTQGPVCTPGASRKGLHTHVPAPCAAACDEDCTVCTATAWVWNEGRLPGRRPSDPQARTWRGEQTTTLLTDRGVRWCSASEGTCFGAHRRPFPRPRNSQSHTTTISRENPSE